VVDLAEIVRGEGVRYLSTRAVTTNQHKALLAIAGCRTEAMGPVIETCVQCDIEYPLFRSFRNRSCPQCQGEARASWLAARTEDILPVSYLHAVFKAPRELHKLALYCPKQVYDILIRAAGQAVIDVGRSELHAQLGCHTQFQTWTQNLARHLHTHCVIPCGGFSEDGSRWIAFEPDELPVRALSRRYRTLVCTAIRKAAREGKLGRLPDAASVDQILARAMDREWKVYAKPPFGGPEQLLAYLARTPIAWRSPTTGSSGTKIIRSHSGGAITAMIVG
jgi:Transposase zinc-binding domain/Putative transposase